MSRLNNLTSRSNILKNTITYTIFYFVGLSVGLLMNDIFLQIYKTLKHKINEQYMLFFLSVLQMIQIGLIVTFAEYHKYEIGLFLFGVTTGQPNLITLFFTHKNETEWERILMSKKEKK